MRLVYSLSFAVLMMSLATAAYALNPQPEPPGKQINELNPQPEPPGVTDSGNVALNPQPEPPGIDGKDIQKRKPSLTQGSDSSGEARGLHGKRKPSLTQGSDSSEKKAHPIVKATLSKGSDSGDAKKHDQPAGPPIRDTGGDDSVMDTAIGVEGGGAGR